MRISDWSSDVCSSDLVFTVEESRALRGTLPGGHVKNLFLRDKKKRCWLVTAMEDRAIDLKALKRRLGASGSLHFGNAELLLELLGVAPGAVTHSAPINDRAGRAAEVGRTTGWERGGT